MYSKFLSLCRNMDAELLHNNTLKVASKLSRAGLFPKVETRVKRNFNFLGKPVKNPISIAAGMDKNCEYGHVLENIGFGVLEFGTVTLSSLEGNPKPRVFKYLDDKNIVNCIGLANCGFKKFIDNFRKWKSSSSDLTISGISIGAYMDSGKKLADILEEYSLMVERLQDEEVDYIALNISCKNVPEIFALQKKENYTRLLKTIRRLSKFDKPILTKISPDIEENELLELIETSISYGISGIICCNTTSHHKYKNKKGGLSGEGLKQRSRELLNTIKMAAPELPVISSGGIVDVEEAITRLDGGAHAIQIYSGLVFNGPHFIKDIVKKMNCG